VKFQTHSSASREIFDFISLKKISEEISEDYLFIAPRQKKVCQKIQFER
jgi:hypothetical protein